MEPRLLRRRLNSNSTAAPRLPAGLPSMNKLYHLLLLWNRDPAVVSSPSQRYLSYSASPRLSVCTLTLAS